MNRLETKSNAKSSVTFSPYEKGLAELQQAMEEGRTTSLDLVRNYLARIDAYDQRGPAINSILRVNPYALEYARLLDRERAEKGVRSQLHGIPIIVKDNFNTSDMPTSSGSVALANFRPTQDAFQIQQLRAAGAIILAKSNMDEFARSINGLSSLGGQIKNPYDLNRTPGGSSSGTAAAITANFAAIGMGTDTCSSIRLPAAFNNLVGFRPTRDLSNNDGITPLIGLMDTAGPLARSAKDIALLMDAILGHQEKAADSTLLPVSEPFLDQLNKVDLSTVRLGRLTTFFDADQDSAVNLVIRRFEKVLRERGATLVDVDSSIFELLYAEYDIEPPYLFNTEISQYLSTLGSSVRGLIRTLHEQGLYHKFHDSGSDSFESFVNEEALPDTTKLRVGWGDLARGMIANILAKNNLDALIYPTSKNTPVMLGESQVGSNGVLSSVSGTPAISLPAGFTNLGLPVGLELLGSAFNDERLVAIAYAIESLIPFRKPPNTTPELVNDQAPEPKTWTVTFENKAEVLFQYDSRHNQLQFSTNFIGSDEIFAICLHGSDFGPVMYNITGPSGPRVKAEIKLLPDEVEAWKERDLFLRLYDESSPNGEIFQTMPFHALSVS